MLTMEERLKGETRDGRSLTMKERLEGLARDWIELHKKINHPEQRKGEVYIGNSDAPQVPEHLASLNTYRFGVEAFDINGQPLADECPELRPVFVGATEEAKYSRLMEANGKAKVDAMLRELYQRRRK